MNFAWPFTGWRLSFTAHATWSSPTITSWLRCTLRSAKYACFLPPYQSTTASEMIGQPSRTFHQMSPLKRVNLRLRNTSQKVFIASACTNWLWSTNVSRSRATRPNMIFVWFVMRLLRVEWRIAPGVTEGLQALICHSSFQWKSRCGSSPVISFHGKSAPGVIIFFSDSTFGQPWYPISLANQHGLFV